MSERISSCLGDALFFFFSFINTRSVGFVSVGLQNARLQLNDLFTFSLLCVSFWVCVRILAASSSSIDNKQKKNSATSRQCSYG